MTGGRDPCEECEAEALLRIMTVRELLEYLLWGDVAPVRGIDAALSGLHTARNMFLTAGHRADEE